VVEAAGLLVAAVNLGQELAKAREHDNAFTAGSRQVARRLRDVQHEVSFQRKPLRC
jgi:hypothetical protein